MRRTRRSKQMIQVLRKAGFGLFLVLAILTPILYTRAGTGTRAHAAANNTINFQARLMAVSGAIAPDGSSYSVEFKLYSVASGGAALWTESRTGVSVKNGYLSESLGSVTPFPGTIDWSEELWLTMNVNGDGEMNPRLKLTGVPLAFRAKQADGLVNGSSVLTANDLAQLAPSSSQVINSALAALRLNQTGAGGLIQFQNNGNDVFAVGNNGDLTSSGSATFTGGSLNLGDAAQAGGLILSDGSTHTATIQTAALGQDTIYTLPDPGGGSATICLSTGNCGGSGDISQNGNSFGTAVTIGSNDTYGLNFETDGVTQLSIDTSGNASLTGAFTIGTGLTVTSGGATVTGNSTIAGTLTGLTGLSSSGTVTFSGLTANRLVSTTAGGQLTTSITSANLAASITNETGTGLAVFGTNPTFTTGLVTASASFNLFNTGATTINAFGAGTSINIGAATGLTNINNNLDVAGAISAGTGDAFQVNSSGAVTAVGVNAGSGVLQGTGGLTITGNSTIAGTLTSLTGLSSSGTVTFSGLGAGLVQSNSSGVLSSGAVDRNTATFFANALNVVNGGTGATSFTTNAILYGNGTGALQQTNVGTGGQILLANGSGVPVFTSVTGDVSLSSAGLATIANDAVTTAKILNGNVTNAKLQNSTINLSYGTNLSGDASVALGGTLNLAISATPSFTSINTGALSATGALTFNSFGGNAGLLQVDGAGNVSIATAGTGYEVPLTFNNGLTRTGNTVGLGGTLAAATNIALGGNNLTFSGSGAVGIGTNAPTSGMELDVRGELGVFTSGYNVFANSTSLNAYGYLRSVDTSDSSSRLEFGAYDISGASQGGRGLVLNPLGGNVGVGGDLTPDGLFSVGSTSQFQVSSTGAVLSVGINNSNGGLTNAGAVSGVTTLNLSGAISGATSTNTINGLVINSGALSGVTGIAFTSGSLNLNNGGITNTGSIAGATTIVASGAITAATSTNTINGLIINAGSLSGVTGFIQTSGNFAMSGGGTFGTGTGAVSLNGATTVTGTNTFTVNGGLTSLDAGLSVTGDAQVSSRIFVPGTSGTSGQGYFTGTPATPLGGFQSSNIFGQTYTYFSTNRHFNGSAWTDNGLSRAGGAFMLTDDAFTYNSFAVGSNTIATRFSIASGGNVGVGISGAAGGLLSVGGTTGNFQVSSSGVITAPTSTNTINGLVVNSGSLSGVTGFAQTSGNFAISGAGTFSTGTGAISLNGNTTVTGSNTFTVNSGLTTMSGNLNVAGTSRFGDATNNATFSTTGGLQFAGTGDYFVGDQRFAFRYAPDPNFGLRFSSVSGGYEFTGGSANTVFFVNAGTGAITANGALTVLSGGASVTGGLNNNNGGITNTGSIAGLTTLNATGRLTTTGGITTSGAITNINVSSNFATNINTGTSTGAINIGGGSAPLTINSTNFDVSSAGAVSGVTTLDTSGNITTSGIYRQGALNGSTIATCSAGQYIGNGVRVSGGIITAGSCRNDATGISDARVKKDVEAVGSVLDRIKDVRIVTFNFKRDEMPELNLDRGLQYGVIAQELEQLFPELVTTRDDGYKEVNFQGLSFYNVRAVGELAAQVDSLTAKLQSQSPPSTENGISTGGTLRLDNNGVLKNITGLNMLGGGASVIGGLNNNGGGITNTGVISGATTIAAESIRLTANVTGDLLELKKDGKGVFTVFNNGALQLQLDSTYAFTVRDNTHSRIFNVDTLSGRVSIGDNNTLKTVLFVLDNRNLPDDPPGVPGASYFNTKLERFRCYDGKWRDCLPVGDIVDPFTFSRISWAQPFSDTEFPDSPRIASSLTRAHEFRLRMRVLDAGIEGATCRLQYALTDEGPWNDLAKDNAAGELAIDKAGTLRTEWAKITDGARDTNDMTLRIMCKGGDSSEVVFNGVSIQIR